MLFGLFGVGLKIIESAEALVASACIGLSMLAMWLAFFGGDMEYQIRPMEDILRECPDLLDSIPDAVIVSGAPFVSALCNKIAELSGDLQGKYSYRVAFHKSSSRNLIAIGNEGAKGLLVSASIEKFELNAAGRYEEIRLDLAREIMPALLGIGMFESIQNKLPHILALRDDFLNYRAIDDLALFERVSETIVDSFRAVPDLALDQSMRNIYLARIVKSNDDCYELFVAQREKFRVLLDSEYSPYSSGYNYWYDQGGRKVTPSRFFETNVLTHSIFAVFDRLVAGRVCEVVLSGNYAEGNIARYKRTLVRVKEQISDLMAQRLGAFDTFCEDERARLEYDLDLTGHERKAIEVALFEHEAFVKKIRLKLVGLLDARLESFDVLMHLSDQECFDFLLVEGHLLISSR